MGGREVEAQVMRIFKQKEVTVKLDLGLGNASFTACTCDLPYDCVRINASSRS